jgi:glyoxylase-like metal-dependent hydrolase (beta-lactamase superfamily II)
MSRNSHPVGRLCASVLLLAIAACVVAQDAPQKESHAKASNDSALSAQLVKTGLYLIEGGGANSLLRFSANGLILVDGKLPGNYRALMSQVRKISKISDLPVRVLIVTDHHENHTGNDAQFLAAHVPIVAQENVKHNLKSSNPSDGEVALPTFTYADDYTLRLGGVEARLVHFGRAHTNGDSIVYFPNLKVIAVGDLYTPNTPEIDFACGGSLLSWGPVLGRILSLDFDIAVPSAGPLVTRAELEAFKTKLDTLVSRGVSLLDKGVTKDQLMARLETDDLGWHFSFTPEQLDKFYEELSHTR